jgi:hypothetical protein
MYASSSLPLVSPPLSLAPFPHVIALAPSFAILPQYAFLRGSHAFYNLPVIFKEVLLGPTS